jgi:hypothetical protein
MAGNLLLKNAVDASAVAFWRKCDSELARRRNDDAAAFHGRTADDDRPAGHGC